jgi:hypothetical protein
MKCTLDLNTKLLKMKQSPKKYWLFVNKSGLLGTAITEHTSNNPKKAYFELLKHKPKNKILIPGMTVSTDSGDVLIYSVSEDLYNYSILYETGVSIKRICDLCKKKGFLVSIAHPFGLISNSATYIMGLDKLEKFIKKNEIGVETYNGMIGYISYYMYDSFFIRKLRQILDFFEVNEFFDAIGIKNLSFNINKKLDQKSYDVVYKFAAAIKLGKIAKFVTAGSGTDLVQRIGSGTLILDLPKTFFDEENNYLKNQEILNRIKNKKIFSVGPPGKYTDELFERSSNRITKKKAYSDLLYLTKKSVK